MSKPALLKKGLRQKIPPPAQPGGVVLSKPALLKKGLRLRGNYKITAWDIGRNLPYLKRDCDT